MRTRVSVAPPNSVILVLDPAVGDIPDPDSIAHRLVAATTSCIAVGSLCAIDGETTIVLADDKEGFDFAPPMRCAFEGRIDTPRRKLSVCNVALETLLSLPVQCDRVDIEVWVNHPSEPDQIAIFAK